MIVLKFDKQIKGSSRIKGYEDWIPIEDLSLSSGRYIAPTSAGNQDRQTGPGNVSELLLGKGADIASPELFMQSLTGQSLGKATIHVLQTGSPQQAPQPYMTIILENVLVSHYSVRAESAGRPAENFQLNSTSIKFQYNEFSGDKVSAGTAKHWSSLSHAAGS